jgi:hypothetical protein
MIFVLLSLVLLKNVSDNFMADAGTDDINKARCADPGPDPEGTLEKNHLLGAGRPGELIARRWALRMDTIVCRCMRHANYLTSRIFTGIFKMKKEVVTFFSHFCKKCSLFRVPAGRLMWSVSVQVNTNKD